MFLLKSKKKSKRTKLSPNGTDCEWMVSAFEWLWIHRVSTKVSQAALLPQSSLVHTGRHWPTRPVGFCCHIWSHVRQWQVDAVPAVPDNRLTLLCQVLSRPARRPAAQGFGDVTDAVLLMRPGKLAFSPPKNNCVHSRRRTMLSSLAASLQTLGA